MKRLSLLCLLIASPASAGELVTEPVEVYVNGVAHSVPRESPLPADCRPATFTVLDTGRSFRVGPYDPRCRPVRRTRTK
jgi:hypothetical protein